MPCRTFSSIQYIESFSEKSGRLAAAIAQSFKKKMKRYETFLIFALDRNSVFAKVNSTDSKLNKSDPK